MLLFSALLHEHLSLRLKTRLERHLLLKSKLRIDSRENRESRCTDLSRQPYWLPRLDSFGMHFAQYFDTPKAQVFLPAQVAHAAHHIHAVKNILASPNAMHAPDGSGARQPSLLHHGHVALGAAESSSSVHAWRHVGCATRLAVVDSADGAVGGAFVGLLSNVHLLLCAASAAASGQRPAEGAFHGRQRHWTDLLLSTLESVHRRGRIHGLAWVGVAPSLHGGLLRVSGVSFWNQAAVAVILHHPRGNHLARYGHGHGMHGLGLRIAPHSAEGSSHCVDLLLLPLAPTTLVTATLVTVTLVTATYKIFLVIRPASTTTSCITDFGSWAEINGRAGWVTTRVLGWTLGLEEKRH